MRNRWVLMAVLLTITGIFVIGCYTILSHPRVESQEEESYSGRYYRENCTDCHVDYHNYPYGYYYGHYPDYYWDYPRWGHYYIYPWWWDRYWGDDDGGGIVQNKKGERRSTLEPPYVPATQGSFPPVLVQPKSSRGDIPRGTIEKKVEEKQPPKKEEKKNEKRKEGKGTRR